MQTCACETTIGEHIPVKDVCLLVREYAGVVDGAWIKNWLNEHGQSADPKFAFRYLYNAQKNQLTYLADTWHGTIAICTPDMVAGFLRHLAMLPHSVTKVFPHNSTDEMVLRANEIGKKLEAEVRVHCEH